MKWLTRFFESKDARAERLLHEAIGKRRDNMHEVQSLINKAPWATSSQLNKERRTAIHVAAGAGRVDAAEAIHPNRSEVNVKDNGGQTPLHVAVDWSRVGMVEWLLQHGADPNAIDGDGGTPLLRLVMVSRRIALMDLEHSVRACTEAQRDEFQKLWLDYAAEMLRLLVAKGADINAGRPFSPLRCALTTGEPELARKLRELGARE